MIGKKIIKLRKSCDWSQSELARNAGITSAAISLLEKHERNVSLDVAKKIAMAFNISLDELCDFKKTYSCEKAFYAKYKKINRLKTAEQKIINELISRLANKNIAR